MSLMKFFLAAKKYWWILLILISIGGFLFYRSNKAKTVALKDKTYTVTKQDLIDSLDISGEIDATEKASLRFQTSGLLTWVGVKEGDMVKKFQVLASLDKRELQNSMNQLLNTYSKTRADFDQTQIDNRDWTSNGTLAQDAIKRVLQKEQLDLNNSVLSVEAKNLALKFANLYTPIAGIVTKVDSPLAGQNITPATATFEVVNPESLYFSALADQTEVTKFKVGLQGEITMDSFTDKKYAAEVESIGFIPKTGETGTVYEIKIKIKDGTENFRLGMTGDVRFVFKENKGVVAVPEAYLKTDNGKRFVSKSINGQAVKTEVGVGDSVDGIIEITAGLKENDVIYSN